MAQLRRVHGLQLSAWSPWAPYVARRLNYAGSSADAASVRVLHNSSKTKMQLLSGICWMQRAELRAGGREGAGGFSFWVMSLVWRSPSSLNL